MLSSSEAEYLIKLSKQPRENKSYYHLPSHDKGKFEINLFSEDNKNEFVFNITRSRIALTKITYQNRTRGTNFVLTRLDLNGNPHSNPDGQKINCPHIHYYVEGFSDKWAKYLPDLENHTNDLYYCIRYFLDYNNIKNLNFITNMPLFETYND